MEVRDAAFNANGTIACEVNHPVLGWIPFTASAHDAEPSGRAVFDSALALNPSPLVGPTLAEQEAQALAEQKAQYLSAISVRRLAAEEAGTTVGGVEVATDRVSQGKLTAAYVKANESSSYQIQNWKGPTGTFTTLSAAEIIAAASAVEAHVQACFNNEAALNTAINSATDATELAAVDINVGWP